MEAVEILRDATEVYETPGADVAVIEPTGTPAAEVYETGVPGPPGPAASTAPLEAYGTYPGQSVAARLTDLIDRKVENDGIDLALYFENRLL